MADEFTKAALYWIKTFNKKVKEKIWMEKLIELYYEYKLDLLKREMRVNWATEREIEVADIEKVDEDELEKNLNKLSDLKPFIKWLVENDKIDLWLYREYMPNLWEDFSVESNIIMNLSIAIDPILYLNYILK